jgi:hypothetical protein
MDLREIDEHIRELTPHQLKIIQAVYDGSGNWLTRAKMAKALGKRRLTPYDINCLKMLAEKGIVLESTQPTTAPGSDFAFVYHMTDDIATTLQAWAEINAKETKERQRKPINLVTE